MLPLDFNPHREVVGAPVQHIKVHIAVVVGGIHIGLNGSNLLSSRARESQARLLARPSIQVLEPEHIVAVGDVLRIHVAMNTLHLVVYDFQVVGCGVDELGIPVRRCVGVVSTSKPKTTHIRVEIQLGVVGVVVIVQCVDVELRLGTIREIHLNVIVSISIHVEVLCIYSTLVQHRSVDSRQPHIVCG